MKGFVALMSVIIISAILLGLTAAANTAGFFSRFSELDGEYKQASYALAGACVNTALLTLAQQYAYAPSNQQVMLGSDSCIIVGVTTVSAAASSKTVTIQTRAAYKNTFTTLQVTAQVQNPLVAGTAVAPDIIAVSWREIP
jgi:hypothetical protein